MGRPNKSGLLEVDDRQGRQQKKMGSDIKINKSAMSAQRLVTNNTQTENKQHILMF